MLNNAVAVFAAPVPPVTNSYESIATVTVGSTTSSISFSSIPSTYKHLQIRATVRGDYAGWGSANMKFNGSSADYTEYHSIYGDGSSAAANASTTSTAGVQIAYGNASNSSTFMGFITDILDYTSTNKNKTVRSLSGNDLNGSGFVRFYSGMWRPATPVAITDIVISLPGQGISQYSSFALYGIKG